ncbi:MAG: Pyrophosphatase [Candidatus Woesebacteria bacterium GW2011_GWA1_33_30]|uniref:Pyrophosphatase n=1 Tax=Candidatus Woesebacteria bacterium GW2011_GWA2_33_28 TaxID=1618561 RepID=A0A0F9ZSH8_9BACT|nr:MAG: Pyrophosphatase [Candidatus Woesebacteria bacterium GW2011_GWA2_33_28]KKP48149.1 MAG: Pyrophosphatase [Candidatus Woesebacteria bacterium GW2011_GWA1_33_30]KKP49391.1 MAG: Pyrophosphatase [Microgenomates group bacterium GW2011_GWC1_33_32]KKP52117.1 MAG: Pyrophosphatase [Candidatus Woesebacteria bacterium GW2011_GWB1_33_38]KKP57592.1 MAG: Pyrophosphatase [Microgenomates group bacterium GW2011_GWD1_33_9]
MDGRSLRQLQELMVIQLKKRGYYPKDDKEVLLRLGEEVGEVFEAVRENQSEEDLSHEIVDVFWNLLRLCELKNIDLEKAFIEKLEINESRPLEKEVTDISQNS